MSAAPQLAVSVALLALGLAAPALPQVGNANGAGSGSSASISVHTQAGKDRYDFAPRETCLISSFGTKPLGLSVVLNSQKASLSIDMPNIDEKHANEIQIVLVVAGAKPASAATAQTSASFEIDTRPEAALEAFKRAARARRGMSGKATTTLMEQGHNVLLSFTGETAVGAKLSGEVTCRKVVSAE